MSDVVIDRQKLVSTTRASELSGYSKDYIGQLCREEKLLCRRMSGHWYVSESSVREYKDATTTAEVSEDRKVGVKLEEEGNLDAGASTIREDTFERSGVEYISTLRAAELTGYAQDYIGQLARNGEIAAQKNGRRWFVDRVSLLEHKKHNDNLLASVQAKASGAYENTATNATPVPSATMDTAGVPVEVGIHTSASPKDLSFNVRYVSETDKELVPKLKSRNRIKESYASGDIHEIPTGQRENILDLAKENSSRVLSSKEPLYDRSRLGGDPNIHVKKEAPSDSSSTQKSHSRISILYVGVTLVVLILALSMYLFGGFEWILNLVSTTPGLVNFLQALSDSYGDILPGAEFSYIAK